MPSRSSGSPMNHHHRNPSYRSGSGGGHPQHHHQHHPYNGPPNHPPDGGGFRSIGGVGFGSMPHAGEKRRFHSSGRGGSPDKTGAGGFAKLFIGSVPRTATEDDIRPLFEAHGNVIEVALIKDRRTGQQQGCCFIKYATSEEADRAIRALHNQYTLPGGVGPIQVRYADAERERLGASEYKVFVASLNRQATEKEVEEIFSPYGRVEDVYIMRDDKKQSRGCGFIKFSHRDMAASAINGLNGVYVMRGCDQPLAVRFADPKRPRAGESRTGLTFGGPGFGPRSEGHLGVRPGPNDGEPMGGRIPPDAWHPMSPRNLGPSSQVTSHGFGSSLVASGGVMSMPPAATGPLGTFGGPANGSLPGLSVLPPSTSQQSFNPSMSQVQSVGQQVAPLQKPLQSPHHFPSSLRLQPQQTSASYSQAQTSLASIKPLGQLQAVYPSGQTFNQALPSQQFGLGGQMPISQPQVQAQQMPSNIQPQAAGASQQLLSAPTVQQQMMQPQRQASTQLAQMSQQTPVPQASFQSSQPAFSQLRQQLHTMQPSSQNLTQQHASQASKQQPSWTGIMSQTAATAPATASAAAVQSTAFSSPLVPASMQAAAPLTCNWSEHTSPEGYKYYYNNVTNESRWEKPEEFTLVEKQQQQQKQQQKSSVQQLHPQPQIQSHPQVPSPKHVAQTPQMQLQTQLRHHQQLQQLSLSSSAPGMTGQQNVQELGYAQLQAAPSSVNNPACFQQGFEAAQDWMWKNKPAGNLKD